MKLRKKILLALAMMMLIQSSMSPLALEVRPEVAQAAVNDHFEESDDWDELDDDWDDELYEDDYIPDGWYDPEYGSLETGLDDEMASEISQIVEQEGSINRSPGVVIVNNTNFLSEPDVNSVRISRIPINTSIRITEIYGDWYRIVHDGVAGWVLRSNVQQTRQIAAVRGRNVALHEDNNENSRVITRIPQGTFAIVLERTSSWSRIEINGQTGWVLNSGQLTIANGRKPGRTVDRIALHVSPNQNSNVVRTLFANQELMILQRTTEGSQASNGWTQVEIRHSNGILTGWIRTSGIQVRNHTRRTTGTSTIPVRVGPGTSYNIDRNINTNTQVTVLAESGSWSRVRFTQNGVERNGWISNGRLTNVNLLQITAVRRTAVTVVNNVDFRRGPNQSYGVIRRISVNTNVRITGRLGNWYRVRHSSTTGWVLRSDVQRTVPVAIVRTNNAPVRASRSTSARILTRAPRGTRVNVTQRTGTWSRVRVNGRTGWIRNSQIRVTNGRRPGRTTAAVNLHTRPNSSSSVRRRLPRHQHVMIMQRTTNGSAATQGWTQVRVVDATGNSDTGWIRTNRVERRNHARRVGGASQINVRTGPGSSFSRISRAGRIPRGTRVTVLSEIGSWSRVRFNLNGRRHYGWVANSRVIPIHEMHHDIETALRRMQAGRNNIGISYLCLTTGRRISVNGGRVFNAASTSKLPTHMMVAEAVHEGRASWNDRITFTEADREGGTGILQGSIRAGDLVETRRLLELSIRHSDNIAHNMLSRRYTGQGATRRRAFFARYLPGQRVEEANRLSPNQLTTMLRILYDGQNEIPGYRTIMSHMSNTAWRDRLYTPRTRNHLSHIIGSFGGYVHDAGIFHLDDHPYVLTVMTNGVGGRFISDVSDEVFRIHRRFEN